MHYFIKLPIGVKHNGASGLNKKLVFALSFKLVANNSRGHVRTKSFDTFSID